MQVSHITRESDAHHSRQIEAGGRLDEEYGSEHRMCVEAFLSPPQSLHNHPCSALNYSSSPRVAQPHSTAPIVPLRLPGQIPRVL